MQNTTAVDDFATRLKLSTLAIDELVPLFNPTTGTIQSSYRLYSQRSLTKMIHHSDLTFVQTADALSAAVFHDRISGNGTYQGWVRACCRSVSRTFPDFHSHPRKQNWRHRDKPLPVAGWYPARGTSSHHRYSSALSDSLCRVHAPLSPSMNFWTVTAKHHSAHLRRRYPIAAEASPLYTPPQARRHRQRRVRRTRSTSHPPPAMGTHILRIKTPVTT